MRYTDSCVPNATQYTDIDPTDYLQPASSRRCPITPQSESNVGSSAISPTQRGPEQMRYHPPGPLQDLRRSDGLAATPAAALRFIRWAAAAAAAAGVRAQPGLAQQRRRRGPSESLGLRRPSAHRLAPGRGARDTEPSDVSRRRGPSNHASAHAGPTGWEDRSAHRRGQRN